MKIQLGYNGKNLIADLAAPLDISIELGQVRCFYAPALIKEPYQEGDFIGSVKAGAPVNFYNLFINPHGQGTHTESLGHITVDQESVDQQLQKFHFISQLVSVELEEQGEDKVLTLDSFKDAFKGELPESIIIRTLPNNDGKKNADYSGTNPPYVGKALMQYWVENGVRHLLLDLPSVDREVDQGLLQAHHIFWNVENGKAKDASRSDCTITELVYIPDHIHDGLYLLNIQVPSINCDAVPSKPVIYKLTNEE